MKDKEKYILYPIDKELCMKILSSDAVIKKDLPIFTAGLTGFGAFYGAWVSLWSTIAGINLTLSDVACNVVSGAGIGLGLAVLGDLGMVGYNQVQLLKYKKRLAGFKADKDETLMFDKEKKLKLNKEKTEEWETVR